MNKPNPHKIKTKVEQTATGEVEYDAIECDDCGYDVPLESAVTPIFPENIDRSTYVRDGNRFMIDGYSDATVRVYCGDCAERKFDNGVLDSPLHRTFLDFWFKKEWRALAGIIFGLYCLASGIMIAMLVIASLF